MRVAFFTDTFYPSVNGVVSGVCNYANGLVAAGNSVVIFAPNHPAMKKKQWILDKRVRVCLLPSMDGRMYPDLRITLPSSKLYKEFKKFNPDVIHTHFPLALGLTGLFFGKLFDIPVVTTCHGNFTVAESLRAIDMYESKIARQIQRRMGFVLKNYLDAHDAILFPTEKTRKNLDKLNLEGNCYIVHVPIPYKDLQVGEKKKVKIRKKYGIKKSILFVGRISKEKNIDILMHVFVRCIKNIPKLQLILVGDGPDMERLKDLAMKLEISKSTIFIGAIAYKDIIGEGMFYLGDIFVTLSEFETQGMSTVEAMACKLPVVGAKAQATTEVIEGAGVLVQNSRRSESAKKIVHILKDQDVYKELQQKGLRRAEEYSIEACTQKLIAVYQHVIDVRETKGVTAKMQDSFQLMIQKIRHYPRSLQGWWKNTTTYR